MNNFFVWRAPTIEEQASCKYLIAVADHVENYKKYCLFDMEIFVDIQRLKEENARMKQEIAAHIHFAKLCKEFEDDAKQFGPTYYDDIDYT